MDAAGFASVAVAAEPPLDVQFDVAVELRGLSDGRLEEMTGDVLAYAFLVHSLSSVDYSPAPGTAGLRWPEQPLHAALCAALAQHVLFVEEGRGTRMPADTLRVYLGKSRSGASVRVIHDMTPKAFGAAMDDATSSHFSPKQALGNVRTFSIRPRRPLDKASVLAAGLDRARTAAAALAERRKRTAEGGGGQAAAKRPHFGPR
jgi:hypothetical protein